MKCQFDLFLNVVSLVDTCQRFLFEICLLKGFVFHSNTNAYGEFLVSSGISGTTL